MSKVQSDLSGARGFATRQEGDALQQRYFGVNSGTTLGRDSQLQFQCKSPTGFNDRQTMATTQVSMYRSQSGFNKSKDYYMKYIHHQNRSRIKRQADQQKNFIP